MQAAGCLALHVLPWAQASRDPSAQSRVTLEEGGGTQMLLVQSALGASPLRLVAGLEPVPCPLGHPMWAAGSFRSGVVRELVRH